MCAAVSTSLRPTITPAPWYGWPFGKVTTTKTAADQGVHGRGDALLRQRWISVERKGHVLRDVRFARNAKGGDAGGGHAVAAAAVAPRGSSLPFIRRPLCEHP